MKRHANIKTKPLPEKESSVRRILRRWYIPAFILVSFFVSVYTHMFVVRSGDPDPWYHLGRASLYLKQGFTRGGWPSLPYSILGQTHTDPWYGFHVLIAPFSMLSSPMTQIKFAGIFLLVLALTAVCFALRRLNIGYAWACSFLVFFITPYGVDRLDQARPQVLTVGLLALLLSFLSSGTWWQVGLVCAVFAFIHLSMFWLMGIVFFVFGFSSWLTMRTLELKKISAGCCGILLGWLMRPDPIGELRFLNVEILKVFADKAALPASTTQFEMKALYLMHDLKIRDLLMRFTPLVLLLVVGIGLCAWLLTKRIKIASHTQRFILSSFILSMIFAGMMIWVAIRSVDFLATAVVMFFASACTIYLARVPKRRWGAVTAIALLVVLASGIYSTSGSFFRDPRSRDATPPRAFLTGQWLANNSQPGDMIFNLMWDDFPALYRGNPLGRYVWGINPSHLYEYDHKLFSEANTLLNQHAIWTHENDGKKGAVDPVEIMCKDFHSKFVIVDFRYHFSLAQYLDHDARCVGCYPDQEAIDEMSMSSEPPYAVFQFRDND